MGVFYLDYCINFDCAIFKALFINAIAQTNYTILKT